MKNLCSILVLEAQNALTSVPSCVMLRRNAAKACMIALRRLVCCDLILLWE